jgi:hypothetical protein
MSITIGIIIGLTIVFLIVSTLTGCIFCDFINREYRN